MSLDLTDEKGLARHKQTVIEAALSLCVEHGEVTSKTLALKLFHLGIGDAKNQDRYELSYSSTGAIARAGLNMLYSKGILTYNLTPSNTTFIWMGEEHRTLIVSLVLTQAGRDYIEEAKKR